MYPSNQRARSCGSRISTAAAGKPPFFTTSRQSSRDDELPCIMSSQSSTGVSKKRVQYPVAPRPCCACQHELTAPLRPLLVDDDFDGEDELGITLDLVDGHLRPAAHKGTPVGLGPQQ